MKRLAILLLVVLTSVTLLGCNSSEFKVDGEFTAYELSVSSNRPVLTTVTVTIDKGSIVSYNIDVRQGYRTVTVADQGTEETSDDVSTYNFGWNEQTKKDLGLNYKMHYSSYKASLEDVNLASIEGYATWLEENNMLDWARQASLIEAFWLANGVDSTETDEDGDFINVASVSISDEGYSKLAKEAVELAKNGEFQAVLCDGTDLYIATMSVSEKGVVSNLMIDVQQAQKSTTEGTFAWKEHTKQDLRYSYKMHYTTYTSSLEDPNTASIEGYEAWLHNTYNLEWFEQVGLICDYIMEHGWNPSLQSVDGDGVSLDGVSLIDSVSSVSISTDEYFKVLGYLFDRVASGEIK